MVESVCHLLMKVYHVIVANFYVANMSLNAIRENNILAKISEFTVFWIKMITKASDNNRSLSSGSKEIVYLVSESFLRNKDDSQTQY